MDRFAARKAVLADLEAAGLLVETKQHKLQVPTSQRTGRGHRADADGPVVPRSDERHARRRQARTRRPQGDHRAGVEAVRAATSSSCPRTGATTYTQWLDNIQDWCVSRAALVGPSHSGVVRRGRQHLRRRGRSRRARACATRSRSARCARTRTCSTPGSRRRCGRSRRSAGRRTPRARRTSGRTSTSSCRRAVLVTGFDIIFFWVARMVMATQYFTGEVPFREVYINAIVRDAEGQKMSKSKGNTIDPLDLIDGIDARGAASTKSHRVAADAAGAREGREAHPQGISRTAFPPVGADALRFTFAALADVRAHDQLRPQARRRLQEFLQQAVERGAVRADEHRGQGRRAATRRIAPATEAERWILDAPRRTLARSRAAFRELPFRPARAGAVRIRLERVLRLVRRTGQAGA